MLPFLVQRGVALGATRQAGAMCPGESATIPKVGPSINPLAG